MFGALTKTSNNCSGALQCTLFQRDEFGDFESKGPIKKLSRYNFINGINNTLKNAFRLAKRHLDKIMIETGEQINEFVIIYNPTNNFLIDGAHTFRNKLSWLFGPNNEARQLAALLYETQLSNRKVNIVAHSEGTAILLAAVKYHNKAIGSSLSNINIRLHGPAINVALSKRHFQRAGMSFFGRNGGVDINRSDAVANIIGLNTWNPINIVRSIFMSPTLSGHIGKSPHTFPVGCTEARCK